LKSDVKTNPAQLIITADDYGLCDSINQAIEECLAAGTVRATCVMANMDAHRAAESLRRKFPHSSLGIHWNVTQGRPVAPAERVPSLLNGDGSFLTPSELRRRWWSGRLKLNELEAELRAQFERLTEIMGPVNFWNTHENIHLRPGLFQAFVNIGRVLKIPATRCYRRLTVPQGTSELRYRLGHPQFWVKGKIVAWWSSRAEMAGTMMPDAKVYAPGYREPETMLEEVIRRLPWNEVKTAAEIVIHPATAIDEALFGNLTESRLLEYHMFKCSDLLHELHRKGIEPVGFDAISGEKFADTARVFAYQKYSASIDYERPGLRNPEDT
jgi:predicted glycoside hydrolase/deacetylase ChbG (UPF0249 family)